MAPILSSIVVSLLLGLASAQSLAGKTREVHPKLETYKCTKRGGCKKHTAYVVLDSSIHPLYQKNNPSLGCGDWGSAPNKTVCPDETTCAKNCVIDGINDYSKYGVTTQGDTLYLDMLRDDLSSLSPRAYLLDSNRHGYDLIKLTGQEFAFDVDVSKLPCGMNGALYFSEMDRYGGKSSLNKGGAKYGNGYCDAQCFTFPFIDGVGNIEGKGACCPELDIWEANSRATSLAPHPCNVTGPYQCTGDECAHEGVCDEWGCVMNPYLNGHKDFYGRGPFGVDTTKPFTVVTQFPADNQGKLQSIHRLYVQNGKVIEEPVHNKAGLPAINYMEDNYCKATGGADEFLRLGGMEEMGDAMSRGMVLAFSIWWDQGGFMQWLDGSSSGGGPCNATEGNPEVIKQIQPDTSLSFSNIRVGEIGSTYMN